MTSDTVWALTDYTGEVKSATKDAHLVLMEVAALDHVLQRLIELLRKDPNLWTSLTEYYGNIR